MPDPRISIVIPCFNEAATIAAVVERVRAAPVDPKEIVVVDDGSTDGTLAILEGLGGKVDRLIAHERNRGKGAALRSGFAASSGEIVVVQDGDAEYDPAQLPRLVAPIADGRADVVYGSRFKGGEAGRVLYYWHYVGNLLLTQLSNAFTNLNLTDMETGYKAFRAEVLRRIEIEEDRFGVEPELTSKVARLGCRVYEIGISYDGRTYAEGKKVGWRDGLRAVWCIVRYGLRRRPRA